MTDFTRELELLGLLQEECAEVIQIISKVRRFGYASYNPFDPSGKSNLTLLQDEIGDVHAILALLLQEGNLSEDQISERVRWKLEKLESNWGYKLNSVTADDNTQLLTDLDKVLVFMRRLTKQGEDSLWRPSDLAIPVIEKAIELLKRPKPRPIVEVMDEIFSKPGMAEAWDEMERDRQQDRKIQGLLDDIRNVKDDRYDIEDEKPSEGKYLLLRQAADILKQLDELPEEVEPEYED